MCRVVEAAASEGRPQHHPRSLPLRSPHPHCPPRHRLHLDQVQVAVEVVPQLLVLRSPSSSLFAQLSLGEELAEVVDLLFHECKGS